MAETTYKCPNCGGYLAFAPDAHQWQCPFCDSAFEEKDLLARDAQQEQTQQKPQTAPGAEGEQMVYNCPNCGSQIMTDETTVATRCYYCHSPVVLKGKLTEGMRPDGVLPFSIGHDKAVSAFMDWVKGKRFIPKGFFSAAQVETMSGVYYPHFVTECDVQGALEGEGRNTSVASTAKYIITSTRHYHVRREGRFHFRDILRPALSKANRKLSDGIHPYPLEDEKPFAGAYLSGFLAERRDTDAASIREDVAREVQSYIEPLLEDDLHYDSVSVQAEADVQSSRTRYVLLPAWVLTYPNAKDVKDPYYYAMNGCTGKVCGKLPIDRKKLWLTGALTAAAVFVAGCLLCYFLF